jgi:hypothetical protein
MIGLAPAIELEPMDQLVNSRIYADRHLRVLIWTLSNLVKNCLVNLMLRLQIRRAPVTV